MLTLILVALLTVLGACSTAPPSQQDWAWEPTAIADEEASGFDAGSRLLSGFDAPRPLEPLARGDSALFGLRLLHGELEHDRTWYLHIECLAPSVEDDGPIELRVRVLDEQVRPLSEASVQITGYLVAGAAAACREKLDGNRAPPRVFAGGEPGPVTRGALAMMDLVRVVEKTDALVELLWEVVSRPSWLSLLGGVRVSAGMSFVHAQRAVNPIGFGEAYSFPFVLRLQGEPALFCTVIAVDPWSPYRICGGLVELAGHAPDDPDRRVLVKLLASRRAR